MLAKEVGRSVWVRHGIWNTLEHALTRVADAATSLLLLWILPTESFSALALAQAWVAPVLLLFIAPETVLYRDYGRWKEEGRNAVHGRLKVFRRFAWAKVQFAAIIALGFGVFFPGQQGTVARVSAMVWGFALALAPQACGPDREFLRLSLHLKDLNALTLLQKLSLFGATAIAVFAFRGDLRALAIGAMLSLGLTAFVARLRAGRALEAIPNGGAEFRSSGREVLLESVSGFSFWNHINGVILNWVQTMDVFFLGLFGTGARELGLYAVVVKLSNFTLALPMALSNLFSVWIGRRSASHGADRVRELWQVWRFSGVLLGLSALQAVVLLAASKWLIPAISHGRWSEQDQLRILSWLPWIVGGAVALSVGFLMSSWIILRLNPRQTLMRVYLPWGIASIVIYAFSAAYYGLSGAAHANVVVGFVWLMLLAIFRKV